MSSDGILILGTPRSGTTLLSRILGAHSRIACPPETYVFRGCGRFLQEEPIEGGGLVGVLSGLGYAGFSAEETLRELRRFAFGFLERYAERQGKPRWAEKTAFNSFYVDDIERLCGSSVHYVCLMRHGLDVVCSLRELCEKNGRYLAELHRYVCRHPDVLEALAHVWRDLTKAVLALSERRSAVVVRYEDLVDQPEVAVTRVLEAVGEAWEPDLLARAFSEGQEPGLGDWKFHQSVGVESGSVGRWNSLPRQRLARLAELLNPTLRAAGYPPVEVDVGSEDEDEVRRRYQLGLMLQSMKGDSADGLHPPP